MTPLTMHPDAEARIRARDAQCWVPERIGIDEPPWLVSARDRRRLLAELDALRAEHAECEPDGDGR